KAQLKRARRVDGKWKVEMVGQSADEFTFFDLTAIDVDGDGQPEIAAQGNKHLTIFGTAAGVAGRVVADFEPVLNTALGRDAQGLVLFVPARPATRAVAFK
ncbi:MAG: hypothetical protein KC620_04315, partial [Myxococcales bacterium]|nr:hypothetical protein [Myxococcales bacterium]